MKKKKTFILLSFVCCICLSIVAHFLTRVEHSSILDNNVEALSEAEEPCLILGHHRAKCNGVIIKNNQPVPCDIWKIECDFVHKDNCEPEPCPYHG